MADTTYTDNTTPLVSAEWLNEVNTTVHTVFENPTTKQEARTALGGLIQVVEATPYTTYSSHTTKIPYDDTIPQNTEGDEIITVSITPTKTTSRLRVTCNISALYFNIANVWGAIALFQDAITDAIAVTAETTSVSSTPISASLVHEMQAGTTSATTFKIRMGINASGTTLYINGGPTARRYGGIAAVRLRVEEIG